jgi:HEAT repeat protein
MYRRSKGSGAHSRRVYGQKPLLRQKLVGGCTWGNGQDRSASRSAPIHALLNKPTNDIAAEALVGIGAPAAKRSLLPSTAVTVVNGLPSLVQIKDTRAVDPLIAALNDSDGRVSKLAATTRGTLGDSRALEPSVTKEKSKCHSSGYYHPTSNN